MQLLSFYEDSSTSIPSNTVDNTTDLLPDYNRNASWFEKGLTILEHYPNGMTSREIAEEVKKHEPEKDLRAILGSLPSVLNRKAQSGHLIKIQNFKNKEIGFKIPL